MTPLQQSTPNATGSLVAAGDGPLGDLPMLLLDLLLALGTFVVAYLLVRLVLVALTNRALADHSRVERVRLVAKVVAFAFAVVVAGIPLHLSTGVYGAVGALALVGPVVFVLALGTVGLERTLAERGPA